MGPEAWAIIFTLAGGIFLHLILLGAWLWKSGRTFGEMKAGFAHLVASFDDFKAQHYITRAEYDARARDLVELLSKVIGK
ncbi:MAG TPA: hypothetical protein VKP61_08830 [Candidatus Acidoferrum sp.]|nr:hypothetical protein [Candidatus Acidoferrum sp.]